ncbi:hypothetical protein FACS189451_10760 [Bacteroidia bacterium]|nr:hypothetical protein FACS189446_1500 [Bacteroidia bacterium]GHT63717.1 hypothetical protein FACS189451_10760 [Bacteroidia bacterium]
MDEEQKNIPLYEILTDEFINEIKRRANIIGEENSIFGNMELKDLDRTQLLQNLKKKERSRCRNNIL